MDNSQILILGAVAYDPKVVTIWNGFRDYFHENGLDFDYILFSNYERQVEALFQGMIHVAWNSPLAWIQSQQLADQTERQVEALCMRDTDCDLTSVVVVRNDSEIQQISGLKNRTVAVGASDSPQATLIPLAFLAGQGLQPERDFSVLRFEKLPGLHGDHIGGERDAAQALMQGQADAACLLEANYDSFQQDGTLPNGQTRILARTPRFDHCNFTVLKDAPRPLVMRFRSLLLGMRYDDKRVRPLLDMEGLREWKAGRTDGYSALSDAVERFGTIDEFVRRAGANCR